MVITAIWKAILVALLFVSSIRSLAGQDAKAALLNLDSLKSNSVLADWTGEFWKDLEKEGEGMLVVLNRKHIQLQLELESCSTIRGIGAREREIKAGIEEVKRFERKLAMVKKMIPTEINQFILQQVMENWTLIKTEFQTVVFSTELPIFMEEGRENQIAYITDWFIQLVEKEPRIRLNWERFQQRFSRKIAKGQW